MINGLFKTSSFILIDQSSFCMQTVMHHASNIVNKPFLPVKKPEKVLIDTF